MKKGFTLIELLAVIVVLAIIAVIAIPTFVGVIERVRKEAVRDSAYGLIDTADLYYQMNSNSSFECDGEKCDNENNIKLQFKGAVPSGGKIIAQNNSELYYIRLGKYCVLGNRYNINVEKECKKLDITNPELILSQTSVTSSKIIVGVKAKDVESGIKKIDYEIDGKNYTDEYDDDNNLDINKTFEGLKAGQEYSVKVTVTNGNDLTTTKQISITTLNLGILKVKFNNTPSTSQNGYFKSQVAYLDYDSDDDSGYFIKTESTALSNISSIKSCGSENSPGDCVSDAKTSLESNKWYYFEQLPRITYSETKNEESIIYARVTNGISTTATSTAVVSKIDATKPLLELETSSVTSKSISVPFTSSDEHSGLDTITCKYSTTSGTYTTDASSISTSNCTINNITHNTTYYYQVCVSDKVGNTATCKTGSSKTSALTVTLKSTNTPSTSQNGYLKNQVWSLETVGNPTVYYVKSTSAATSSVNLTKSCGTDTNPGTCTDITATKNIAANTWYYTTSKPSITYNKQNTASATLYARITDGKNTTSNASATVSKIDATKPLLELETSSVTSKSISVPFTSSDEHSGLKTFTCKYSNTNGSYTTDATVLNNKCIISDVNHNTTYYYEICSIDLVGNKKCLTDNSKTLNLSVTLKSTNTPEESFGGYYKTQVWNLTTTGNPTGYYVKSTRAATSSVNLTKSCGTDTNPGTCTSITSTKSLAANTWYYTENKPSITYSKTADTTAILYTRISDGKNETSNASAVVSKIKETLDASEVSYTHNNWNVENVQEALDDLRKEIK